MESNKAINNFSGAIKSLRKAMEKITWAATKATLIALAMGRNLN